MRQTAPPAGRESGRKRLNDTRSSVAFLGRIQNELHDLSEGSIGARQFDSRQGNSVEFGCFGSKLALSTIARVTQGRSAHSKYIKRNSGVVPQRDDVIGRQSVDQFK